MIKHEHGSYIEHSDFCKVIDWLLDEDDRDVMLSKLEQLKQQGATP